jgi:phosphatidylethanolamine/phosphatidyl-N-methylethanolamine N-methyltransferase
LVTSYALELSGCGWFPLSRPEKTLCCRSDSSGVVEEGNGMGYWADCRRFFGEFRHAYFTTGSILPSSRALGRALASEFTKRQKPCRILEVGPGTGAVTVEILRRLGSDDRFDIVEINERFVAHLEKRFEEEPLFRERRNQARLIHAPLQDVPGAGVYDFMISGLPLNNFPLALVRDIFKSYQRLLRPGGVLTYFEYLGIRRIKSVLVGRRKRRHLHVLGRFLGRRIRAYQFREQWVFCNVPPAVARHMRF